MECLRVPTGGVIHDASGLALIIIIDLTHWSLLRCLKYISKNVFTEYISVFKLLNHFPK